MTGILQRALFFHVLVWLILLVVVFFDTWFCGRAQKQEYRNKFPLIPSSLFPGVFLTPKAELYFSYQLQKYPPAAPGFMVPLQLKTSDPGASVDLDFNGWSAGKT